MNTEKATSMKNGIIRETFINAEGKIYVYSARMYVGFRMEPERIFIKTFSSPECASEDFIVRRLDSTNRVIIPKIICNAYNLINRTVSVITDRDTEEIIIDTKINGDYLPTFIPFNYTMSGKALPETPIRIEKKMFNKGQKYHLDRIYSSEKYKMLYITICLDEEKNYILARPASEEDFGTPTYDEMCEYCGAGLQSFCGKTLSYLVATDKFDIPRLFVKRLKLQKKQELRFLRYSDCLAITTEIEKAFDNEFLYPEKDHGQKLCLCHKCAQEIPQIRPELQELLELTQKLIMENERLKKMLA